MSRLAQMPPMSPETTVIRNYLDWLIDLPWTTATEDNLDINHAAVILEQNHYGLPKVKERILEHIAVRKLAQEKMKSPILCFVGPPGTGKTSLGRSIAEALGRKFVRLSLGGVRRSRNPRPPANLHRFAARTHHPDHAHRRVGQPALHAGRDRQARHGLPG